MSLSNILHPNRYHGSSAQPPFFEGWYYKLISADERICFAIIPGVYLAPDPAQSHCFVQVFNSETNEACFHRYPYQEFKPSPDSFEIMVGPNYFSAEKVTLAMDDDLGQLEGELIFKNLTPWPAGLFSPGAMGWFAWVPFMECYHGVVSMDHTIQGGFSLDGKLLDFTDGRGYMEKDWGKHFPSAWIWGQSNHFAPPGVSLMLSVAVIPWLGRSFAGYIIGFAYDGVIHRFTTYNRGQIEAITLDDQEVNFAVRNPTHRLQIRAQRKTGGLLHAPTEIAMDRRIIETMNASLEVRFEDRDGKMIFQGTGQHAGLETVGDLDQLLAMIR